MSALSAVISNARAVGGRAVHVKVHPRPRTINESREILRVLEGFGEVLVYKNLKYEVQAPAPNTVLAIFRKDAAADRAIQESPLYFKYGQVGTEGGSGSNATPYQGDTYPDEDTQEAETQLDRDSSWGEMNVSLREKEQAESLDRGLGELHAESSAAASQTELSRNADWKRWSTTPASDAQGLTSALQPTTQSSLKPTPLETPQVSPTEPRSVMLSISPSALNHPAYISRQYYHGSFTPNTRNLPGGDLELRVPAPGLADLRLNMPEVPLRVRMKRSQAREGWTMGLRRLWEQGRKNQEKVRQEEGKHQFDSKKDLEFRRVILGDRRMDES